ncbi:MAG: YdeI/OmpD-associated family protein [Yoonia sp.]|nr:YdeI/OmpD-associated family protein [Yoonia sp.]
MITNPADYFTKGCGRCTRFETPECSTRLWTDGLVALRQICTDTGLIETVKWSHPCYTHNGRNIAILGAFRTNFRLTFMNAALLKDADGVLEKQGPNSQTAGMISFTDRGEVASLEPTLRAYLKELMEYADAGIKASKVERDIVLPDDLVDALDADPELSHAFHNLTPGRQRSYVINLNGAKKSETRVSRIAGFRGKIIAGKGALAFQA